MSTSGGRAPGDSGVGSMSTSGGRARGHIRLPKIISQNSTIGKLWTERKSLYTLSMPISPFSTSLYSNQNNKCRMYEDVPRIVSDILKNGAKLAIVSRNTSKEM